MIVKLTATGSIEWQKSFGGSGNDDATSVQATADGRYIVAGSSGSNDGDVTGHHGTTTHSDYWIVKLTATGVIEWQKSFGGTGDEDSSTIQKTADGGYIIGGYSTSTDGDVTGHHGTSNNWDWWVVKLTARGTMQWQKSLGGVMTIYLTI